MKKIDKKELHELFVGLKNKNQNAYNKLYEKYYGLVYGIAFSILKNKEDSEDITHEIFTKIYKMSSDKLPTYNEASWLYTVSKNECFLHIRKTKPNISVEEIYEIPAEMNGIDDVVDREYFNKLMSGLKEDEKMILLLKVLSGFTFKKISQVMNIPIGTVQWKYYNAINSIKISLGSLVGAVMAFVFVISRGMFTKKQEIFNKEKHDKKYTEESSSDSSESSNKEIESKIKTDESSQSSRKIGMQTTESATVTESTETPKKIDPLQVIIITIGLAFLIIFVIFFKKYQQKFKKKSSK
ncbi:MAG: sigma-70 family RNA polymerase sigma factor [Clostridia bacterium]|nr:sigma-70 family RNA polymerase sigma factor [Clostridia bacterium]